MTWLGINPNAVSEETKRACAEILAFSQEYAEDLNPTQLATAFNIIDPELCKLSASEHGEYVREEAVNRRHREMGE